ncbi:hypothetical protein [Streptomyces sp. NPDC057636]|uniref:hypothetical protein n=1 Tax=Streptomyces sp. NPDC057636 TaxID=3346189 RepID=UPI0036CDECD0
MTDNDPRMRYHGEMLPVLTPALRRGLLDARRILRTNRFRSVGRSMDLVIDGERGTGKTLLLSQVGRGYQGMIESDLGSDANRVPVVYINVPPCIGPCHSPSSSDCSTCVTRTRVTSAPST